MRQEGDMGLELGSSISPGWLGCGSYLGNTASFLCRPLLRRTECSGNFKMVTFLLPLRGSRRGFFSDLHREDCWGPQGGFSHVFISEGSHAQAPATPETLLPDGGSSGGLPLCLPSPALAPGALWSQFSHGSERSC